MENSSNNGGPIKTALRALRHRNYRLYFIGQGISLVGSWMQSVAIGWLVYRLTGSSFMLGLVGFASQLPSFIFSPLAGVLSDRWDRRRILTVVQVLAMIQAAVIAAMTMSGLIAPWHVVLLGAFLGLVNAFDMPVRQSFVVEILDNRTDLGNAIALNSSLFNGSRLIGPAIAGLLIAVAGEGLCFLVNAFSFIGVIWALASIRIPRREARGGEKKISAELKEGFLYAFGFKPIRDLLALVSMISFIGMTFPVLLPVFAARVLGGGSHTYGFLVAATGAGAMAGTLYLAARKSVRGLTRVIMVCLGVFGAGLLVFSWSRSILLSTAILAIVGFGMIVCIASCNTIIQTIVEEDKRGRVMSFYTMCFMGSAPLGSIIAGSLSSVAGAPLTVRGGGVLSLIVALVFLLRLPRLRDHIRPIYRKMGIIPEVALGIQSATDMRDAE